MLGGAGAYSVNGHTVTGVQAAAAAAAGGTATSPDPAASAQQQRRLARARHATARTYQDDRDLIVDYGVGGEHLGELHLYGHINLNGREVQVTPHEIKNNGPAVDPWMYADTETCGNELFGPQSGFHNSWYPSTENLICNLDTVDSVTYAWYWNPQGTSYQFNENFYSSNWTCSSLYTQPCYFGS